MEPVAIENRLSDEDSLLGHSGYMAGLARGRSLRMTLEDPGP